MTTDNVTQEQARDCTCAEVFGENPKCSLHGWGTEWERGHTTVDDLIEQRDDLVRQVERLSARPAKEATPSASVERMVHHPLCSIHTGKQGFRCDYDCGRDFGEQMARALCIADHENPDEDVFRHNGDFLPPIADGKRWQRYIGMAKAAFALFPALPVPSAPKGEV